MTWLLQQLEASHEYTGHRVMLLHADEKCTNSVNTDVPGFRLTLSRTGWMWKLSMSVLTSSVLDVHTVPKKYTDSIEISFAPFYFSQ